MHKSDSNCHPRERFEVGIVEADTDQGSFEDTSMEGVTLAYGYQEYQLSRIGLYSVTSQLHPHAQLIALTSFTYGESIHVTRQVQTTVLELQTRADLMRSARIFFENEHLI